MVAISQLFRVSLSEFINSQRSIFSGRPELRAAPYCRYFAWSKLLSEKGIVGGLALSKYYQNRDNEFLVCVTETNTKAQIDSLVEGLRTL